MLGEVSKKTLEERYAIVSRMVNHLPDEEVLKYVSISAEELGKIKRIEKALRSAKGNIELGEYDASYAVADKVVNETRKKLIAELVEEFSEKD